MFMSLGSTAIRSSAANNLSYVILSNAFAQSSSKRKAFVIVLSPAVMTLLMLYSASFVPLCLLNPYCVVCSRCSMPSANLRCTAAANSL